MKQKKTPMMLVSEYTGLAFLLPVSIFVGYAIGYYLDKAFGTHFFYLIFLLVGIAAGLIELIRKVTRDNSSDGS